MADATNLYDAGRQLGVILRTDNETPENYLHGIYILSPVLGDHRRNDEGVFVLVALDFLTTQTISRAGAVPREANWDEYVTLLGKVAAGDRETISTHKDNRDAAGALYGFIDFSVQQTRGPIPVIPARWEKGPFTINSDAELLEQCRAVRELCNSGNTDFPAITDGVANALASIAKSAKEKRIALPVNEQSLLFLAEVAGNRDLLKETDISQTGSFAIARGALSSIWELMALDKVLVARAPDVKGVLTAIAAGDGIGQSDVLKEIAIPILKRWDNIEAALGLAKNAPPGFEPSAAAAEAARETARTRGGKGMSRRNMLN